MNDDPGSLEKARITHPHPPHFFNSCLSFSTEQFRHVPTAMVQAARGNEWQGAALEVGNQRILIYASTI